MEDNNGKMSILTIFICRFNMIPIKIPASFCGYQQIDGKGYLEMQNTQNIKYKSEGEQSCRTDTIQAQDLYKAA